MATINRKQVVMVPGNKYGLIIECVHSKNSHVTMT